MLLNILIAGSLLLSKCGGGVHPDTLNAIIEVESNHNTLAIYDNTTRTSYRPLSKEQAIYFTEILLSASHSIDIGLMQINSQHLSKLNINYKNLFDPCYNVAIGTKILTDFYREHARNNPSDKPDMTLLKALSSYNTGSPHKGKKYVQKILKAAIKSTAIPIAEEDAKIDTKSISFFKKGRAGEGTERTKPTDEVRKAR
jgi:type IV secretion system protein VirB1